MTVEEKTIRTTTATVVSKSGDKSIKVAIEYKVKHPKYGKYVRRRTTFGVHDEHNQAGVGDIVEVTQCRPMSKTKSRRLVRIVQKAVAEK
ncbi:MAG: 30S ribosomal protein S17 [Phycisphaerae bacterium]|nr:30S ribosomal protein S17 [Phycisphaerae bacterium]